MPDEKHDVIPVEKWGELVHDFGKDGVPVPFVHDIFLLECMVAGTGYVDDLEAKTASLSAGSVLELRREPGNRHDALAILVLNPEGKKIGYVPRDGNPVLSRLMDAGKLLYGKVKDKKPGRSWLYILIEIYMKDF